MVDILNKGPTFAILSDYSGIIQTDDGFGCFRTKAEALESLVDRLETERLVTADNLRTARAELRNERRKALRAQAGEKS